jgi:hypothetical protein
MKGPSIDKDANSKDDSLSIETLLNQWAERPGKGSVTGWTG